MYEPERMTEFRDAVLYQLQGTAYTKGLPTLPNPTAQTNHALAATGDIARFRIVTMNATGNEKGAKPFKITRP